MRIFRKYFQLSGHVFFHKNESSKFCVNHTMHLDFWTFSASSNPKISCLGGILLNTCVNFGGCFHLN